MVDALWITLIGMGLVFLAILLLWGLMALLVRVTAQPEEEEPEFAAGPGQEPASTGIPERKRQAAAAAVAIALAMNSPAHPEGVTRPGTVSAWQAAQRASQLSQRTYSARQKVVR